MAARNEDIMEALQGREEGQAQNLNRFFLSQTNFKGVFEVHRMDISYDNESGKDIFEFAKENKERFVKEVEKGIEKKGSIKMSYGLEVEFKKPTGDEKMKHYFYDRVPYTLNRADGKEDVKQTFDDFMEQVNGEIESWADSGSGWVLTGVKTAYVNIAKYKPLRAGAFFKLPEKLANKKAIINVQNRDEECLKWALRAALFPTPKSEKHPERTSKYPVNDGINYS